MSGFTIRAFRPGDGEALADLHRRAILASSEAVYSNEQKESWAFGLKPEFYDASSGVFEVAVDDDGVARGFCHAIDDEVLGFYVDPNWQRRGIGAALLARAEAGMAARGIPAAHVKATLTAQPFYERHGYAVLAQSEHKTRGGLVLPCVILEKQLGR